MAQAVQDCLPIVFVVEDNGYGISTPTLDQLPFRLGIFGTALYRHVDGRSVDAVAAAGSEAIAAARRGDGPTILWVELDRLTSQTGRSKAYYLRELISMGMDDLEDLYLAAATMERVRKGEERVFSLDDVERDLGLAR